VGPSALPAPSCVPATHHNYVPLNCLTTTCPAHDWRTPPMVAAYHAIVTRTCGCAALGIGCIDTADQHTGAAVGSGTPR
jgi:hypothetical protein